MRLACLLVLACACSSPAPAQTPLQGHSTASHPLTPPPSIRWAERTFVADRFPVVASDGSVVVLALIDSDGGRGNPNLRLEVRDRRDALVERHVVMTAAEAEQFLDDAGTRPQLDARIADANRWLANLHLTRNLIALPRLATDEADGRGSATRATGAGVTVTWDASILRITRGRSRLVERKTPPTWLIDDKPMCTGCVEICSNPAFLAGAAVDAARSIAVIGVGYTGTDTCWEPADQAHVVSW
jgi:hypothetical protein